MEKKSILNSEPLNNSDDHNITSANVTAKTARKMFVLKMLKPPNVERNPVEQNLSAKATYELPFKVTMENKLRCFQYKYLINQARGPYWEISARGLDSTDRAHRGPYKKDLGPIFSQYCPEQAWLIRDLLYD